MTKKLSTSPDRNFFHAMCARERAIEDGRDPDTDENVLWEIKRAEEWNQESEKREQDPAWQKDNMEYDLRTCDWMLDKVRSREEYAQNLYAAMCNNGFVKNDVWPILKNQTWGCSWRYAGGIVAHMRGQGDYIDWYCSGIKNGATEDELAQASEEDRERYHWMEKHFAPESVVTDEIREDLLKLGWIVVDEEIE